MKTFTIIFFITTFLFSCNNSEQKTDKSSRDTTKITTLTQADTSSSAAMEKENSKAAEEKTLPENTIQQSLVLTSNALQLVNQQTGSSTEINFGISLDQMVAMLNKVLQNKVSSIQVNSECGAGPLKMASWNNGLTVVFQEKKSNSEWQFAGWFMNALPDVSKSLTTMAGIGIGSTRAEMESAYTIKVSKTSLGHEFSTSAGLFGIFNGPGKDAKITNMWSGTSCNFR